MTETLLQTKLHRPPVRPNNVSRPRLIERLDQGLLEARKLTLISAPAGFGKTSLVSSWAAGCGLDVAWLSLDEGDSNLGRFLTYLVAALQTIDPALGRDLPGLLQAPQPPGEAMLTLLLNDVATLTGRFILVLDDYHVIDAQPVDDALAFLLEHLPPPMHVAIASREDPPIPLARLRARGQLTELRDADLRFTGPEAAGFLNEAMGLNLSAEDIMLLEGRTEGWIAGLKLAALSMQGREDVSEFIRAFSGDHRYILDFLVEEVLQQQPAPVRSFLLQTSILSRLSGPLCDAVTGQANGQAQLEALERGNFFLVPLGDRRQWYRYHRLFADVLAVHLAAEQPDQPAILHRRASAWHEQNGLLAEAIHHALAAGEFARAADLVERAWPAMRQGRQEAALLLWFQALPAVEVRRRPVLAVAYAHVLLASGQLEGVAEQLRDAELRLEVAETGGEADGPAAISMLDEEALRRLPVEIAIARAGMALAQGDVPATMASAQRALELAAPDDDLALGAAAGFLGLAYWTSGELEAAYETFAGAMARVQKAGNIADAINGSLALADIRIAQGRLRAAMRLYERSLQLAAEKGGTAVRGAADLHVGIANLLAEWNDLQGAAGRLQRSQELGDYAGFPQNRYRRRVAMARLQEAQGHLDGALALLEEAARLHMIDFYPNVRPIAALKTRVWLAQGRLGEALEWAQARGLSAGDELSYLREFEHITLARLLLARQRLEPAADALPPAVGLLARLMQAAEAGQRLGSVIEIAALQALALQMTGDTAAALAALGRALALAEPEGYVRLFLDEGPAMAALLQEAAQRAIAPGYVRQLLGAFGQEELGRAEARPRASEQLLEPLSERELEVLRLLSSELSGPEIARQLVVSLSTFRTHTRNIYSKLGVNSRRAAVRRAAELDLL